MKINSIIKVVASYPRSLQDEISVLLNKEFKVLAHWEQKNSGLDKGEIQVYATEYGGIICLNKDEYLEID